MISNEKRRYAFAIGLCLAVILLWMVIPNRMKRTWDLLDWEMVQMLPHKAGEYGIISSGPELNLRVGTYRLRWKFDTDGENEIHFISDNQVDIVPSSVKIGPGSLSGETDFTVYNETDNYRIEVDYQDGTYLTCEKLVLEGRGCTDTLFSLSFALICLAVLRIIGQYQSIQRQIPMLLIVFFAAVMASLPCLKDNLNLGDDMNFHLERLSNLTQGLLSGQFPVRMGTYMNKGFGSIVSAFYPETFLYPTALMILAGASIQYAVHVLLICINLITALGAYRLGKLLFSSDTAGTVCSVLYTLAIYRLTDIYTRSAIGEALAMAVLPYFAVEFWSVLSGEKQRWPQLSLSAAALLHAHLITTAVVALVAVIATLTNCIAARIRKEKVFPTLVGLTCALTSAALLGLCLAGPMVTYLKQGVTADAMGKTLSDSAMAPAQLLSQTGYDLGEKVWDGTLRSKGYEVGVPLLLSALFAGGLLFSMRADGVKKGVSSRLASFCLATGLLSLVAASRLFPWDALPVKLQTVVSFLQFPWRLLMLCDLMFAICGAFAAKEIVSTEAPAKLQLTAGIAVISLCLVSVMPMLTMETRKNHYVYYGRVSEQGMVYLDYALKGTDSSTMTTREVEADGVVTHGFTRAGTNLSLEVKTTDKAGTVTLPVFAFEGWTASLNGATVKTERSETNRLKLLIPENTSGTLQVRFTNKFIWHVLDTVSLVALLSLTALAFLCRHNRVNT
ncbi:MAG: hypothetical protein IJ573_01105 [Clostridia bacterium]|nr:hypothetical protein [Clostridia bacterium]